MGLHLGAYIWRGVVFGKSFRLIGDLCIPKNSSFGVQSESLLTTFNRKNKYRGAIYSLSMVIHCPHYAHRILNVSRGIIFGGLNIRGRMDFELVYRGVCIRDFTVICFQFSLSFLIALAVCHSA